MNKNEFTKLWLFGLAFKLLFSSWLPLFSDEAYYWVWSHNLQLSYYDHPPMIAWMIWLGQFLEPFGHAIRWPSVIFAHFSLVIWFKILEPHFSYERLKLWAFLAFFTPLSGLGSMILTPDLPLILFWSLSLLAMDRAIEKKTLSWYILLGVALGLTFCSKYHAVLFVPMLLLWLTWKRLWSQVRWSGVFLTIFFGLLFSMPVIIWNWQNDWVSFKFQLDHGLGAKVWKFKWTWRYFYGQILLVFPVILYFALKARKLTSLTWLPIFSWFPLIFFFSSSFKGKVEANWPIIAYPCILVLAIYGAKNTKWLWYTVRIWIVLLAGIIVHLIYPWIPTRPKDLKTYEFTRYKVISKVAESYQPFFASSFQMASKVWYDNKIPTYKLNRFGRIDFFDYLEGSFPDESKGVYFFAAHQRDRLPRWAHEKGHRIVRNFPLGDKYVLNEVHFPKGSK